METKKYYPILEHQWLVGIVLCCWFDHQPLFRWVGINCTRKMVSLTKWPKCPGHSVMLPAQVWHLDCRSMTPCRGSIKPPSLGRPPSITSANLMPPSVTDIRLISSGLKIPNWIRLTCRTGALESPVLMAAMVNGWQSAQPQPTIFEPEKEEIC